MNPTPSQTIGPFFGFALTRVEDGGDVRVEGQLFDGSGEPVRDGLLEVSSGDRLARCRTDDEGAFAFTTVKSAPFVSITLFARGLLRHLNTRMYFPGEEDEVLGSVEPGRRQTLVARPEGGVLRFDIRLQGPDETIFFV